MGGNERVKRSLLPGLVEIRKALRLASISPAMIATAQNGIDIRIGTDLQDQGNTCSAVEMDMHICDEHKRSAALNL